MNAAPHRELALLSAARAAALVKSKQVSPVELARACLARIEALNPSLNAFISVTAAAALEQAKLAESEVRRGEWRGPLHGIPIALKDMIDTAGTPTTAASALYKDRVPARDAAVVERLRRAGAVLLGKLNMQEFAYGGTSIPSHFGPTRNPWRLDCVAGGSSGGSAAAVAAGLCYGSLGTDTGGSIRQPAAFCGVVGLKATHGCVSTRGVIPLAPSLDHVGPLARTVGDCALLLEAIAGYDCADITSEDHPIDLAPDAVDLGRMRIGIAREFFFAELDGEVAAAVESALALLSSLGARTREVAVGVSTDRTVFRAEAFAHHAAYLAETPQLYLPETRRKLELGARIDAPTYIAARRHLAEHAAASWSLFTEVDVLITPTAPVAAPRLADYPATFDEVLALEGSSILRNTRPFNMLGIPTLTLPVRHDPRGVARRFTDRGTAVAGAAHPPGSRALTRPRPSGTSGRRRSSGRPPAPTAAAARTPRRGSPGRCAPQPISRTRGADRPRKDIDSVRQLLARNAHDVRAKARIVGCREAKTRERRRLNRVGSRGHGGRRGGPRPLSCQRIKAGKFHGRVGVGPRQEERFDQLAGRIGGRIAHGEHAERRCHLGLRRYLDRSRPGDRPRELGGRRHDRAGRHRNGLARRLEPGKAQPMLEERERWARRRIRHGIRDRRGIDDPAAARARCRHDPPSGAVHAANSTAPSDTSAGAARVCAQICASQSGAPAPKPVPVEA